MASVQAMPGMQAGMAALPPNITQEQVQQAYQVRRYTVATIQSKALFHMARSHADISRNSNA